MAKPKSFTRFLNKVVELEFLDHVTNGDVPMLCRLWGRVIKVTPGYLVIRYWEIPVQANVTSEEREDNTENQTIIISCIEALKVLK